MIPAIVLASSSTARAAILRDAGLAISVVSPLVDEAMLKRAPGFNALDDRQAALILAEAKARSVASLYTASDALVIGADQILVCDGQRFDKPPDLAAAAQHLQALAGRTHRLVTAMVGFRHGCAVFRHVTVPKLTMYALNPVEIAAYLADEGEACLTSVGAYRIEGRGIQLFRRIEGDLFSVRGLPLLPLLARLRRFAPSP